MRNRPFNIMVFPTGSKCNMSCKYCYYKKKDELSSDDDSLMMSFDTLERFIKEYIRSHPGPNISFIWQGGEPTLRGLNFYKKAVQLQKKYMPDGWYYENCIQTNGINIDKNWAKFFREEKFLVGLSLDGPELLHNKYRLGINGESTFNNTIDSLKILQKYDVNTNVLCVVSDFNVNYPKEIYEFFKSKQVNYIQFIPLVTSEQKDKLSEYAVNPLDYGNFLIKIFNEWILYDYGNIFIQMIEECVNAWFGRQAMVCKFAKICGDALALEYNGDLYSCDHFVFPENKLGNININQLKDIINLKEQIYFGESKLTDLPEKCLKCKYLFICNGGCKKNRLINNKTDNKLNYLCEGYKLFFEYIEPYIEIIIECIKKNKNRLVVKKKLLKYFYE